MVDLWLMQSHKYIDIALEEGFRQFSWQVAYILKSKHELFSWMRIHTAAYGSVKVMMIDHSGAAEYNTFGSYEKPTAVYPTWTPDDDWDTLVWLLKNNVGLDEKICSDENVHPQMRPVFGQKHRVVVYWLPPSGPERQSFMMQMRELQLEYPHAELFVSGANRFSDLFGIGLKAVDYLPHEFTVNGLRQKRIILPSGRQLHENNIHNPRYSDWFDLIGMAQWEIASPEDRIRVCLRSANWANKNFELVTPFISRAPTGGRSGGAGFNTVFMPSEYVKVSDKDFVLPAARRRVMRNLGLNVTGLDKFTCDTCILHNACKLYREGSVCTVKGSDTVALADAFGSRSADVIMTGLSKLVEKNAERLENAMAAEEAAGEIDPEVTKLSKTVFDQGVKLVKLIDPTKAGGPKVQVNVGVGAGGQASVGIAGTDPKQLMATIVAELEAGGIPRDQITGDMIKGVLRSMANVGQQQALTTAITKNKTIAGTST